LRLCRMEALHTDNVTAPVVAVAGVSTCRPDGGWKVRRRS
jgi:hypothetical protein